MLSTRPILKTDAITSKHSKEMNPEKGKEQQSKQWIKLLRNPFSLVNPPKIKLRAQEADAQFVHIQTYYLRIF